VRDDGAVRERMMSEGGMRDDSGSDVRAEEARRDG
jgi:hypothetical protein